MEWKKVIICSVVGFLGLLSAAMGFVAEANRIKASQIGVSSSLTCTYPSSPATGLGLGAAAALTIAQIIVGAAISFSNSRKVSYRSNSNWRSGKVCLYASWVTFIYAVLRLIAGAEVAEQNENGHLVGGTVRCFVVKPGVYATGAALSLAAVVLGIVAYLAMDSAKTTNNNISLGGTAAFAPYNDDDQGGFAIGHPQLPQPSEEAQLENRHLLAHEFSSEV